jgi:hypothetical protein
MKKLIALVAFLFSLSVSADTIEVQYPSQPGPQGTTLWGDTTIAEINKYTDHVLVPRFVSGARGKNL